MRVSWSYSINIYVEHVMKKFIKISTIDNKEISRIENFIEVESARIKNWKDIDLPNILSSMDIQIGKNNINQIYFYISKLIIQMQSELLGVQRNLSHAKFLSILPHNKEAYKDIEQACANVRSHVNNYRRKALQLNNVWNALNRLAVNHTQCPYDISNISGINLSNRSF